MAAAVLVDYRAARIIPHSARTHEMPTTIAHERRDRHVDRTSGEHRFLGAFEVEVDQALGVFGVLVDQLWGRNSVAVRQGFMEYDAVFLIRQILGDNSPFE